jgi:hypothetical protein
VSKYLVLLIGALTGFSMLGIDWSKTQWLVAAPPGAGLRLQEIFANFVSGLIILFEKPIRLGDTVTIRDLTGTVTKIKTRATTIVDWDRKEIIVPNKAFITEQFINWSCPMPSPGSAAHSHRPDPESQAGTATAGAERARVHPGAGYARPEVFLIEFTDSALIYEIRLYVNNMDHRMPITHEVHSLILEKLGQVGMHLPHQQIDIRMSRDEAKTTTGAIMQIIAHRGASGLAPENTLKAMSLALDLGAKAIELDVQWADGELWVFHDRRLERCTNGQGVLTGQSRDYLASLDAGDGSGSRPCGR